MIFYFTGTGNSLYAARKLADEGEQIVSIVEALRSKAFHYTLSEGEKLGFAFPAYFYRCPVSAIQYGKKTASRGRYVNPVLK